jgi:hydrogenase 3 maturation protease
MVHKTLKEKLRGKVAIVGIGNVMRGDDGAGPELIGRLKDAQCMAPDAKLLLIDAGEVPENYLSKIIEFNPDTILLIDAVDFQESPGSIKLVEQDEIINAGLSTHNSSLVLVINYLRNEIEANVLLLGIQPKGTGLMTGLSEPVKAGISKIEQILWGSLACTN